MNGRHGKVWGLLVVGMASLLPSSSGHVLLAFSVPPPAGDAPQESTKTDDQQPKPDQADGTSSGETHPEKSIAGRIPWPDEPVIEPEFFGYCPVSYFTQHKAVQGKREFGSMYKGKLYYLSSQEAKNKFEQDPKSYLPQFGGLCTTALGGSYNNHVPSDPEVFMIHKGKLYLFSSERARSAFLRTPRWFILRAEREYDEPAIGGYCPVTYQRQIKAMEGRSELRYEYNDYVYYFLNSGSRAEFVRHPDRYAPQYNGYCALGVSKGLLYPVDPTKFFISNNKTYLFHDEMSLIQFTMNPEEYIKKADARWARMQADQNRKHAAAVTSKPEVKPRSKDAGDKKP